LKIFIFLLFVPPFNSEFLMSIYLSLILILFFVGYDI
jgi:hypothetical protein